MRGLATAGPWFTSSFLCLKWRECRFGARKQSEGCPDRPPRPTVRVMTLAGIGSPFLLLRVVSRQAVAWGGGMTVVATAQAKAASSRAMATVTTLVGFPARRRRR